MNPEFEHPTYVIDLEFEPNWNRISDATLEEPVDVFVKPEGRAADTRIVAKGTLKAVGGGRIFEVVVTTAGGTQSHQWTWEILQDAIKVNRKRGT